MRGYSHKVDANQSDVVRALERAGFQVFDLSRVGGGMPDLLVYRPLTGYHVVEVKSPGGTLTPQQVRFHERVPVEILRTVDDVVEAIATKRV
jgi:hypothetical protein